MTRWWHRPAIRSPVFIWVVIVAAIVIASVLLAGVLTTAIG